GTSFYSRGAAVECSPGRQPGVNVPGSWSPGGTKRFNTICRPSGASELATPSPGLTPGATFCRRSAAIKRCSCRTSLGNLVRNAALAAHVAERSSSSAVADVLELDFDAVGGVNQN